MAAKRRSFAELATGAVVILIAAGFLAYALINTGRTTTGGIHLTAEFTNVGSVGPGTDVRVSGVKIGSVTGLRIDPQSYQAILDFTVRSDLKLPEDSSAVISTGGLLGGSFVSIAPGGSDKILKDGGTITITQSATNLEDLLGKFIFNVGSLADATQKMLREHGTAPQ
ncbi:MAG TPA: outer membrane lipid asymmetry maintenance protein MlaD [Acetobacteraceae bacterium]|jgi:phospholipid/cholesterol/gamma-HCH transport system substrate-binding protein|nr:outer membrane lipid asymmetry maintenance protein MlaD [Acetobacteraceae bacterium]